MQSRRKVLAATGVAIGLAGCAEFTENVETGSNGTNEGMRDEVILGDVLLQGTDSEDTQSVQIAVEGDSGVVHLDTYAVEPGDSAVTVDREWDDNPAEYTINIRVDGEDREEMNVRDQTGSGHECVDMLFLIAEDGSVSVWDRACVDPPTDDDDEEDDSDDEDHDDSEDADDNGDNGDDEDADGD